MIRSPALHSTVDFFYLRYFTINAPVPHARRPHARRRTPSYDAVKFPVFRTPLYLLNVDVWVCRWQDRFHVSLVIISPSNSSCT